MEDMLAFLAALEQNNSREWFHAHKDQYRQAAASFEDLVRRLTLRIRAFDDCIPLAQPGELTFKLNRDTRFSRDKAPYNPAFRAHIGPHGKQPVPVGYYLLVRPGDRSFLGGGLFADMFQDASARVRAFIAANGGEWERILAAPAFTARFTLGGTALKRVPRGYDPDHPQAEYLKYKSWYLEFPVPDRQLLDGDFAAYAAEIFAQMQGFNRFLNRALEGFELPAR